MEKYIRIKGARAHNLKNIDVNHPRDKLVVITGLSGSGKSSLAFDTIYAEGQRRYVESLSSYARQFLGQMDKPDVDQIDGPSPAISIDQKTTSHNPRSTVGTVTEIYDYLRLLFARAGHRTARSAASPSRTVGRPDDRQIRELPERTKLLIMAQVVRGKKGEHKKVLAHIRHEGMYACASTARSWTSARTSSSRRTRSTRSRSSSTASSCAREWNRAWPTPSRRR